MNPRRRSRGELANLNFVEEDDKDRVSHRHVSLRMKSTPSRSGTPLNEIFENQILGTG